MSAHWFSDLQERLDIMTGKAKDVEEFVSRKGKDQIPDPTQKSERSLTAWSLGYSCHSVHSH